MSILNDKENELCLCGCGLSTPIAKKTRTALGHIRGQPIPFINGHNRRKQDRYKVEERGYGTPCWIWLLGKNKWGYGVAHTSNGSQQAHRVVYEEEVGPIEEGLELDHKCRNRECVNPKHLEPVSCAVNVQRGLLTKLNVDQVKEIRELAENMSYKEIAPMFGVSPGNIGAIVRRDTWKNV